MIHLLWKIKLKKKWLGDILSEQCLEKSVEATINVRYGKILSAIFELKAVLEDLRMQMIGGIKCGMDIWEIAIIPSLLNNADTWVEISSQSINRLNQLQNMFLQTLLGVGQSCPRPALCWDTATLSMKIRIYKAKLLLINHIKKIESKSLAKQVFENQNKYGWPGLVSEIKTISEEWSIPDITKKKIMRLKLNGKIK